MSLLTGSEPLLWLALTLLAYGLGVWLHGRTGGLGLFNPVLVAVVLVGGALLALQIPYPRYAQGAQFLHFLLGPATVALAVPLWAQRARLRRIAVPLLLALGAGLVTATASALMVAAAAGLSRTTLLSLAPKSVTTPIALGIAEKIGGNAPLAVLAVIVTGTLGAAAAVPLFRALRLTDDAVKGVALGVSAHGVGTAQAFQISAECGAFAGLAMALAGLATALLLPLALRLSGLL